MQKKDIQNKLNEFIDTLPVISDHDHHLTDDFFNDEITLDKLMNNSYVAWTGFSCNNNPESRKTLLENVSFNSYFFWLEKGIQKLHNISENISIENWDFISETILKNYKDTNFHFQSLIKNNIKKIILDTYWYPGQDNGHPELFIPTFRIDKFMYGYHKEAIAPEDFIPWKEYQFSGKTLDEYIGNMKQIIFSQYNEGKVVALKCAEAYNRDINFLPDDKEKAANVFGKHPNKISNQEFIIFNNYVFNRCCEIASELNIPFQIHTGLGMLSGSQPINLISIIEKYPNTNFVLFHAGYPWTNQISGIIHNYTNAFPSLTWTTTISTSAAVSALNDYIDVSPSIQNITWGSDCWMPEDTIGALLSWKFVIVKVLTERIIDKNLSINKAEKLAELLLYKNNEKIYNLK